MERSETGEALPAFWPMFSELHEQQVVVAWRLGTVIVPTVRRASDASAFADPRAAKRAPALAAALNRVYAVGAPQERHGNGVRLGGELLDEATLEPRRPSESRAKR